MTKLATPTVEAIQRALALPADAKRIEFRQLALAQIERQFTITALNNFNDQLQGGLSKCLEACHCGVHAHILNGLDQGMTDVVDQFVEAYNDPDKCVVNARAASGKAQGWHINWQRFAHNNLTMDASHCAQVILDRHANHLPRTNKEIAMQDFDVNKAAETYLHICAAKRMFDEDEMTTKMSLEQFTQTAQVLRGSPEFVEWRKEVNWDNDRMEGIMAACNLTIAGSDTMYSWAQSLERCETVGLKMYFTTEELGTNQPEKPMSNVSIPSQITQAVNTLIGSAIPSFDIERYIDEHESMASEIESLKKAASAPRMQMSTSGESEVDGSKLKYEIVMRKASDLFRNPATGRSLRSLDFELPTLEWTDEDGNVVTHPMQPVIDDNYQFRAKHVLKLGTAMLMNRNLWAHGHTGTGKTTLLEQFYARLGFPVYRVNLDSNLERSDLTGTMTLESHDGVTVTKWTDGILPQAMQQPCALVLDEIDAGRPDILFTIQRALESKGLLLTEDAGRLVKPHELFRFAATANSKGQGDEYGIYAGVRPMNMAMLDRFPVFIEVDYLSDTEESSLLERTYPSLSETVRTQMCSYAKLIREAFKNGEISLTLSPRGLLSMAEFYTFYEGVMSSTKQALDTAVEMTTIDKAADDNVQRVRELANRAFG